MQTCCVVLIYSAVELIIRKSILLISCNTASSVINEILTVQNEKKKKVLIALCFHYKLFTHRAAIRVTLCIIASNCAAAVAQSCTARVQEHHVTILRNHTPGKLTAVTLTKKIHFETCFFCHWTASGLVEFFFNKKEDLVFKKNRISHMTT